MIDSVWFFGLFLPVTIHLLFIRLFLADPECKIGVGKLECPGIPIVTSSSSNSIPTQATVSVPFKNNESQFPKQQKLSDGQKGKDLLPQTEQTL